MPLVSLLSVNAQCSRVAQRLSSIDSIPWMFYANRRGPCQPKGISKVQCRGWWRRNGRLLRKSSNVWPTTAILWSGLERAARDQLVGWPTPRRRPAHFRCHTTHAAKILTSDRPFLFEPPSRSGALFFEKTAVSAAACTIHTSLCFWFSENDRIPVTASRTLIFAHSSSSLSIGSRFWVLDMAADGNASTIAIEPNSEATNVRWYETITLRRTGDVINHGRIDLGRRRPWLYLWWSSVCWVHHQFGLTMKAKRLEGGVTLHH